MDTKILINDLLNDYYTAAWLGAMPDMPANEHQIVSVCGLTCSVGQQKLRVAFLFFFLMVALVLFLLGFMHFLQKLIN